MFDVGNGEYEFAFCQGTAPGCVETFEEAVCDPNAGACVDADIRTCRGDQLIYDCSYGRPWIVDCTSFEGTCEGDHCLVPGGIICDDDSLVCQPGASCGLVGICINDELVDAGVPDTGTTPDAGTESEKKKGCTCATAQNGRGSGYLLALVAAWFIMRRRAC